MYFRQGEEIYHGKFNSAIWRHFYAKRKENVEDKVYLIYDKGGAVVYGTNMDEPRINDGTLLYRYFATTWLQSRNLLKVQPIQIGTYWLYLDDADVHMLARPLNRPYWLRYVNSSIAHVRNI